MGSRRTKTCPHCGEEIPQRALACPECGSDSATGWADEEEIAYQSVDIPDAWPPPDDSPDGGSSVPRWVRITALVAVIAILVLILYGLF